MGNVWTRSQDAPSSVRQVNRCEADAPIGKSRRKQKNYHGFGRRYQKPRLQIHSRMRRMFYHTIRSLDLHGVDVDLFRQADASTRRRRSSRANLRQIVRRHSSCPRLPQRTTRRHSQRRKAFKHSPRFKGQHQTVRLWHFWTTRRF